MSRIRADKLVNRVATGAPQLTYGVEIPVGYGITGAGNISITGVITATTLYGDGSGLTGVVGSGSGVIIRDGVSVVGTAGTINFGDNLSVSPISAGIVTVSVNVLSGVQVTGIATFEQLSAANLASVGIATLGQLTVSGVATATTFVGNLTGTATTATTVDITNTNGLTTVYYPTFVENRTDGQILRGDVDLTYRTDDNILTVPKLSSTEITVSGIASVSQLTVSGVSTFTSNPVLIGAATSTGTETQPLQVTGGGYISGSVGIGTTVASSKLTVLGGDIAVGIDTSTGIILTSPNGTRFRLIVDNTGALSTTAV
jgi:hypothetical protein